MDALIVLLKVAAAAYVLLLLLAFFFQDRLIFLPQPRSAGELQAIAARYRGTEEIRLTTPDGVTLHGWFVRAAGVTGTRAPVVVYYGGNAEEVSWLLSEAGRFEGYSLLLVNYRGYGGSSGKPGEAALFADALQVFDYAAARADVDASRVVIMGRSLGSAMAVHVAARRAARAVVLVSPFDSMVELGRRHHPYLPASLLMRQRFNSIGDAPQARAPLLTVVALQDTLVPPEHSRRLVDAWGGPTIWREISGADHVNISNASAYWDAIAQFLAQIHGTAK